MNTSRIIWGGLLIGLGTLFLLEQLGLFDLNATVFVGMAFVVLGVTMLLEARATPAKRKPALLSVSRLDPDAAPMVALPRLDDGPVEVKIEYGAGRLQLAENDTPEMLVTGQANRNLHQKITQHKGRTSLEFSLDASGCLEMLLPWTWFGLGQHDWRFYFSPDAPLHLKIETGASQNDLDLTHLHVKSLRLETGASRSHIALPHNAGKTDVRIEAGAANLNLSVPPAVAARIKVEGLLSSIDIDRQRFIQVNNVYQTPDYDQNPNRADIQVEIGAGQLTVH